MDDGSIQSRGRGASSKLPPGLEVTGLLPHLQVALGCKRSLGVLFGALACRRLTRRRCGIVRGLGGQVNLGEVVRSRRWKCAFWPGLPQRARAVAVGSRWRTGARRHFAVKRRAVLRVGFSWSHQVWSGPARYAVRVVVELYCLPSIGLVDTGRRHLWSEEWPHACFEKIFDFPLTMGNRINSYFPFSFVVAFFFLVCIHMRQNREKQKEKIWRSQPTEVRRQAWNSTSRSSTVFWKRIGASTVIIQRSRAIVSSITTISFTLCSEIMVCLRSTKLKATTVIETQQYSNIGLHRSRANLPLIKEGANLSKNLLETQRDLKIIMDALSWIKSGIHCPLGLSTCRWGAARGSIFLLLFATMGSGQVTCSPWRSRDLA
jgi:hypothetical protein